MSGSNPFRHRKPAPSTHADTVDVAPRGGSGATGQPPTLPPRATNSESGGQFGSEDPLRPPRPGKTVRIASPPTERIPISPMTEDEMESPVFNFQAVAHSNHRGSPPPLSRGDTTSSSEEEDEQEEGDDPFNPNNPDSSGSENEEAVRNTLRQNQRSSWSLAVDPDGLSAGHEQKPEGPAQDKFSRSMGFSGESDASLAKGGGDGNSGSGRAALDVDSFKRLLLTGDSGGTQGLGITRGHPSSTTIDSGEKVADYTTAFQSRYPDLGAGSSLPGKAQSALPPSSNDSVAISGQSKEKKKPPPPKTRHGKPIKRDEPQTAPSQQPTPQRSSSSLSISEPLGQSSGSLSGADRVPLATPAGGSFTPDTDTDSHVLRGPPETSSPGPTQFKRPPTPPLARRQSQLRSSKNALSRSNSGRLAQTSTSSVNSAPSTTQRVPPPPPRRQDRISMTSSSDHSSQYKAPFPTKSTSELGSEGPATQQSLSRTNSTSSTKQYHRPPNSQPPRPPPPRRLRGSSRSSADSVNPPSNPTNEVAKASEDEGTNPVPDTSNANDILADLSKLQREVDELRGQYTGRNQN